jgi:hypothetical protein
MDSDWMLIGIVIAGIVYFSGYRTMGVLTGLLFFIVFAISVVFVREPKEAKGGPNVLEPIVIESTRGAPFRIPDELELQFDPEASEGWKWEKAASKWGKSAGKVINVGRGE